MGKFFTSDLSLATRGDLANDFVLIGVHYCFALAGFCFLFGYPSAQLGRNTVQASRAEHPDVPHLTMPFAMLFSVHAPSMVRIEGFASDLDGHL